LSTLERAIQIAVEAHAGQTDKADRPYILHPLRVMFAVDDDDARTAAVLHDTLEDTSITVDQLREEGFGEEIIEAVEALTKMEGEDYTAFVERAARNPIARRVKLADIEDNMDLFRLEAIGEEDLERITKYHRARQVLLPEEK